MNREPIYAALFAKLKGAANFKTAMRGFKHWSDVAPADQPALFMVQRHEVAATTPGMPTVWTFDCDVLIYAHTRGDASLSPASILNPLIDAVVAALEPNPVTNKCTLGGLVHHAWVEGSIETDEGLLGDQGFVLIPVVIKAT